jgi:hypothetical protein
LKLNYFDVSFKLNSEYYLCLLRIDKSNFFHSLLFSDTEETSQSQGVYAAISFSYGSTEEDTKPGSELKLEGSSSCHRPPFPSPDSLLNNLVSSSKHDQN